MEFSIVSQPDSVHIMMSGQFTFRHNQKFKEVFELLNNEALESLVVNLKGVEFIDSAGLGMLLLLRDQCLERNIAVSLLDAQGQVSKIFAVSKFDQLFSTSNTEH